MPPPTQGSGVQFAPPPLFCQPEPKMDHHCETNRNGAASKPVTLRRMGFRRNLQRSYARDAPAVGVRR
jgi:hypothetical protein